MSPNGRMVTSAFTRAGAGQSGRITSVAPAPGASPFTAQRLEEPLEVARRRRAPGHRLLLHRMDQRELAGVQRLAVEREPAARAAPIDGVADQRMADVLEV